MPAAAGAAALVPRKVSKPGPRSARVRTGRSGFWRTSGTASGVPFAVKRRPPARANCRARASPACSTARRRASARRAPRPHRGRSRRMRGVLDVQRGAVRVGDVLQERAARRHPCAGSGCRASARRPPPPISPSPSGSRSRELSSSRASSSGARRRVVDVEGEVRRRRAPRLRPLQHDRELAPVGTVPIVWMVSTPAPGSKSWLPPAAVEGALPALVGLVAGGGEVGDAGSPRAVHRPRDDAVLEERLGEVAGVVGDHVDARGDQRVDRLPSRPARRRRRGEQDPRDPGSLS